MIETGASDVPFDEFSRVCDLVEAYFGETVDDVAVHAPVSKRQLVAVLARAQLSGRELVAAGRLETADVVSHSSRETLCWLDGGFWAELRDPHQLTLDESRAAREVHRRIVEAVDGDVAYSDRERDPFVFLERSTQE